MRDVQDVLNNAFNHLDVDVDFVRVAEVGVVFGAPAAPRGLELHTQHPRGRGLVGTGLVILVSFYCYNLR